MRINLMILDSFGIGRAVDAKLYNDEGSNTYASIAKGIKIPNLIALGLNNIQGIEEDFKDKNIDFIKTDNPLASYGRMVEISAGKDTITGHYEIAGIISNIAQPTFPNGFDKEIIEALENAFGISVLGNKAASGTVIINELGDEHYATKKPIIYTSADSVLQIAMSEDLYSISEIYEYCEKARKIMQNHDDKIWGVARIIARPFIKQNDKYIRTENRKDFSLKLEGKTLLEILNENHIQTIGIGKIYDIFAGAGISKSVTAHSNNEVGNEVINSLNECENDALIFSNFVDFDMLYGHRNDISGYRKAIEDFDIMLPNILKSMREDDITIITADHGCDPSTPSTDHSRENVPLIIYSKKIKPRNLGEINGFNYVSKFILNAFNLDII